MLNLYEGVMDTNLVLPLGPERCRVVFDFFFAARATAEAFIRDSIAVADQFSRRTSAICEEVQRGLGSRSYRHGAIQCAARGGGVSFSSDAGAASLAAGRAVRRLRRRP